MPETETNVIPEEVVEAPVEEQPHQLTPEEIEARTIRKALEGSPERVAADATAKVFVTTIAEGVIQSLVNIMQKKDGGMTQDDVDAVCCLASLYGVEVEEEKEETAATSEEKEEEPEQMDQLLDENGNPIDYEDASEEELEAAD